MAVKKREELMKALETIVGESTEETTLAFLEDITDTLDDYDNRLKDSTDWKSKFEENDEAWKKKYKDRFFGSTEQSDIEKEVKEIEEEEKEIKSFDDLFKEEEK